MSRQTTVSGVGVELACAAALLVFVGLLELRQRVANWLKKAHLYHTLPGYESWGVRRRENGHLEISLGRWCSPRNPTRVCPVFHQCLRCASLTHAAADDRCGRCRDWPEYDPQNPTVGDFARLAEHIHATRGQWTDVVAALLDAMKAASLGFGDERS